DDTLREHAVLVESNDPAESSGIELPEEHDGERSAAGIDLVGREVLDLGERQALALELRADSPCRLTVGERLRLGQTAGDRQVLLRLVATGGARRQQKMQRRPGSSLVQELEEGVLAVVGSLTPDYRRGIGFHGLAIEHH